MAEESRAPDEREQNGANDVGPRVGPHPGYISSSSQYIPEQRLRKLLRDNGCDPAREEHYRLQGVQLIDNVRLYLQLPVRTFDTACTYYHKFRLNFRDAEYNYQDAALASLLVACKVEDTIKKSRDILCAAYNIKTPDKPTTQDDKIFLTPAEIIIGLERLILETIGFDFRTRHPQRVLVKAIKIAFDSDVDRAFYQLCFKMSIDLYKTFAPIKQTTAAMVLAIITLCALLTDRNTGSLQKLDQAEWKCDQGAVTETIFDLLDLYTESQKATRVGGLFDQSVFMSVRLRMNNDVEQSDGYRYQNWCSPCDTEDGPAAGGITNVAATPTPGSAPGSATSPATTTTASFPGSNSVRRSARGQESTIRFVLEQDMARREQRIVNGFYSEEYEEYEVDVEEIVVSPPTVRISEGGKSQHSSRDRRDNRWSSGAGGYHSHSSRHYDRGQRRTGGYF